jgi:hypothetical protein
MNVIAIIDALSVVPDVFKKTLIAEYEDALLAYRVGDWEKVGLKAGKFCEVAYCICSGHANGAFPVTVTKPQNFQQSCLKLEQLSATGGRSLCIQVPRILLGVYELRNNRAIGHVNGEISPNHMDAEFYLRAMKWVLAEFVRFFSKLPLDQSHALIEALTVRVFNIVWSSGDVRRVLQPAKTAAEKVLILLYTESKQVEIAKIQKWIEYRNPTDFKKKVLRNLHQKALIHFDELNGLVQILPPGQVFAETKGLLVATFK